MSSRRVYQSIYPREGVAVFWARPVEVREIDAHSPLPISLLNHDYIRKPFEVVYFSNETYFQQLPDLFCYCFVSLLCEHSLFLSDGQGCRLHIQFMNYDRGINLGHVFMAPCKHILIHLKESYEGLTYWLAGQHSYPSRPFRP